MWMFGILIGLILGYFIFRRRRVVPGKPVRVVGRLRRELNSHGGRPMLSIVMNNREKVFYSIDILDEDGQRIEKKPDGVTVNVVSDNPAVVKVTPDESGLSFKLNSKKNGSCNVSISVSGPQGFTPFSDTIACSIVNSAPSSVSGRLGTPVPEDASDDEAMPEDPRPDNGDDE